MDEEYLPEYGPKWSDQRAERLVGALSGPNVELYRDCAARWSVRSWGCCWR